MSHYENTQSLLRKIIHALNIANVDANDVRRGLLQAFSYVRLTFREEREEPGGAAGTIARALQGLKDTDRLLFKEKRDLMKCILGGSMPFWQDEHDALPQRLSGKWLDQPRGEYGLHDNISMESDVAAFEDAEVCIQIFVNAVQQAVFADLSKFRYTAGSLAGYYGKDGKRLYLRIYTVYSDCLREAIMYDNLIWFRNNCRV